MLQKQKVSLEDTQIEKFHFMFPHESLSHVLREMLFVFLAVAEKEGTPIDDTIILIKQEMEV